VLLKPDNAALHARAGVAYLSADRLDLARKELERASEIAPHSPQIQRDLARVVAAQFRGI
jgi:Flp pilus assembly protein TadD